MRQVLRVSRLNLQFDQGTIRNPPVFILTWWTSRRSGHRPMKRNLSSKPLIVAKGLLFLVLSGLVATLLFLEAPTLSTAVLLAILVWASCRFYYFMFYVLEQYVNPELRYAGLLALLAQLSRNRGNR